MDALKTSHSVEDRIERLPGQSRPALLALWGELFGVPAPTELRRELLVKFLAYRIQEQAYGGLSQASRKRLKDLARKLEEDPKAELSAAPRIKVGTRIVREWQGKSHCVTVVEAGFEYAGKHYASLSEIARLITGTRWSGPLFFRLRTNQARKRSDAQRN